MKILFLDQFNEMGGAQQCLLDLVDSLPRGGLVAALPGSGRLSEELLKRDVAVHELPAMNYGNGRKTISDAVRFALATPRMASAVEDIASAHDVDLLYVNGPRLLPAASRVRREMVFHAHSYLNRRYSASLARRCLRRSGTRSIACCDFVASALRPHAAHVIYNGVREIPFRFPGVDSTPRIGIVGRIAPEKGQIDFVRAARMLTARGISAQYFVHGAPLFSGSRYLRLVHSEAGQLPIEFAGWSDAVANVFAGLDILVVPSSRIEATSRVILEAFSAGVVVVAYPSGGIPEVVENGVTGVLTASSTPQAIAVAVEELLADPRRMISMALAARRAWEQRFTLQRYVREVQEFLGVAPRETRVPQQRPAALQS